MKLLLYPPLGLFAGLVGTLIGAGGGFILVPVLLALLPDEPPGIIVGISQVVVFLNSLSGSVAYARQRRIDYQWAALFSATGLAGAAVGALITANLSRERFQVAFGAAMLLLAAYLLVRPLRRGAAQSLTEAQARRVPLAPRYLVPGALIGLGKGILGGLLGIGGGIVLVPVLVQLLLFPAHIATATSQLVILLTSPGAIAVLAVAFPLAQKAPTILLLGIGAMAGAPLGARVSQRVPAPLLVRILAVALGIVAVRLLMTAALGLR